MSKEFSNSNFDMRAGQFDLIIIFVGIKNLRALQLDVLNPGDMSICYEIFVDLAHEEEIAAAREYIEQSKFSVRVVPYEDVEELRIKLLNAGKRSNAESLIISCVPLVFNYLAVNVLNETFKASGNPYCEFDLVASANHQFKYSFTDYLRYRTHMLPQAEWISDLVPTNLHHVILTKDALNKIIPSLCVAPHNMTWHGLHVFVLIAEFGLMPTHPLILGHYPAPPLQKNILSTLQSDEIAGALEALQKKIENTQYASTINQSPMTRLVYDTRRLLLWIALVSNDLAGSEKYHNHVQQADKSVAEFFSKHGEDAELVYAALMLIADHIGSLRLDMLEYKWSTVTRIAGVSCIEDLDSFSDTVAAKKIGRIIKDLLAVEELEDLFFNQAVSSEILKFGKINVLQEALGTKNSSNQDEVAKVLKQITRIEEDSIAMQHQKYQNKLKQLSINQRKRRRFRHRAKKAAARHILTLLPGPILKILSKSL